MSEEGYQGYENWETWNVSLWLSNDQGMYSTATELMIFNAPRYSKGPDIYVADDASKALEEYVYDLLEENIISDKISIHRVDWQEVMMGFQEEIKNYGNVDGETEIDSSIRDWVGWFNQVEKNPSGNYA